ncbi:hypothetical protein SERLA73DRAFT_143609, partial [Serpula lacrymans var. lacrymans S7.3]
SESERRVANRDHNQKSYHRPPGYVAQPREPRDEQPPGSRNDFAKHCLQTLWNCCLPEIHMQSLCP